jgi:multidrug resistance efflux pump
VAGGFFRQGERLFSIEDTDYRLALERAEATRAKAEYELATIESQAEVARVEWERLYEDSGEEPNPLVLYEPQLKNARAALASAGSSVRQAEIDLERTRVRASFLQQPCALGGNRPGPVCTGGKQRGRAGGDGHRRDSRPSLAG